MKWNKLLFLVLFILLFGKPLAGLAEEEPRVEPNEYQEKNIDIQTDYFHDEELLNQKEKIPEEQKRLTFEEENMMV